MFDIISFWFWLKCNVFIKLLVYYSNVRLVEVPWAFVSTMHALRIRSSVLFPFDVSPLNVSSNGFRPKDKWFLVKTFALSMIFNGSRTATKSVTIWFMLPGELFLIFIDFRHFYVHQSNVWNCFHADMSPIQYVSYLVRNFWSNFITD